MKKIYITGQEVKEHLELYKRGSALSSVKKILENPKRLSELGFSLEQFKQIDEDIKQVNVDYINWKRNIRFILLEISYLISIILRKPYLFN